MRTIAAVTVGRSDFGIYRPVFRAIERHRNLQLRVIATGAHLSPEFGWTVNEIADSGFEVSERVDMLLSSDTPSAIATSMGLGTVGCAQAYQRLNPDIVLVLGDRFEMHAAAAATVPFRLPLAHIHGGELTFGAIDDAFRHAITKYSHLHFVANEDSANRVIQMGEAPWRVTLSGAPSLDNLKEIELLSRQELEQRVGLTFDQPPLMVTYHPVTMQFEQSEKHTVELLAALGQIERPIVITRPNADTNGRVIIRLLEEFAAERANVVIVDNLGTQAYFSLMKNSAAMVGNSSSGIIEAATFKLPVVNIGIRQQGRMRSGNVIDVGEQRIEIMAGIQRCLSVEFRTSLQNLTNVYGDGQAADLIVEQLANVALDEALTKKEFHDVPLKFIKQPQPNIVAPAA